MVLGGRGQVGKLLVPLLESEGHRVVVASRVGEVSADLVTGEGLVAAVAGADTVVLLASNPKSPETVDVRGTENLLDVLESQHLVYLSIVGVDRHPLPYYQAKRAAELMILDSGCPHTIVRATQFHSFVEWRLKSWCHRKIALVPAGYVFQPVAAEEVAGDLARIVKGPPGGLVPDFAGPEILPIATLARTYMTAKGQETPLIAYPKPGGVAAAYRDGVHTNPERAVGVTTWATYLRDRFGQWPFQE